MTGVTWRGSTGLSRSKCVNLYSDYLDEPNDFNMKLMDYLNWYNTEKPHRGVGKLPPLRYYLGHFLPTPQKSNMLWTLTPACLSCADLL